MVGPENNRVSEGKGGKFLELIDEQNSLQWKIVSNIIRLVQSGWDSPETKAELESLVKRHTEITGELNGLDGGNTL